MTRQEFIDKMVEKGKITPEKLAKLKVKAEAKARFKKDKNSLKKDELVSILDVLTE